MDLVVNQVMQFEVVHITDCHRVFKRFTSTSVEELDLSVNLTIAVDKAVFAEELSDVLFICAVKDGGADLDAKHICHKTEVDFQHLTDVHT